MTLGAAYALSDSLHVYVRNTAAEDKTLKQLATWCGRFSSMVSLVPPQALVLEVGGSLVFFGGLERLLQQFHEQLSGLGYHFALAVAPTPLGATLLARARYHQPVIDQQLLISTVMRCPISVLHLTDKQYDALTHLGLKTIGECLRLPREGLARRLGVDTLLILDKALGRIPDPRQAFVAPHRFKSTLLLPADVTTTEALLFPVRRLLLELTGVLAGRSSGAQFLLLNLLHNKKYVTRIKLNLVYATCDVHYLLELFRERLERVVLQDAVREISLQVKKFIPLTHESANLFAGDPARQQQEWAGFIERLRARLGDHAVTGLCAVAEHRPECAWRYGMPGETGQWPGNNPRRPLWLLPQPERLALKDGKPYFCGVLSLQPDRERIESGWWDGYDIARDYFVAHNPDNVRVWVYRELTGERHWFLHGIFG